MSSASPPKEPEADPVTQSGDEADHMEREHQDLPAHGQGEFEVKEQDRWLPIANGSSLSPIFFFFFISFAFFGTTRLMLSICCFLSITTPLGIFLALRAF